MTQRSVSLLQQLELRAVHKNNRRADLRIRSSCFGLIRGVEIVDRNLEFLEIWSSVDGALTFLEIRDFLAPEIPMFFQPGTFLLRVFPAFGRIYMAQSEFFFKCRITRNVQLGSGLVSANRIWR